MSEIPHKDFLLSALRGACLRAKMWDVELTSIATALKSDMISPELAVIWLKEMGGLDWLDATTIGLVTKEPTPMGKK
jgi:hypothetical protein